MSDELEPIDRIGELTRRAMNSPPPPIEPSQGLEPPDRFVLGTKVQMTIPSRVRHRWVTGGVKVMALIGIPTTHRSVLILPKARASAWLKAPFVKRCYWDLSVAEGGNFTLVKPMLEHWDSVDAVVRIDLGYCYLLVPAAHADQYLKELRGGRGG